MHPKAALGSRHSAWALTLGWLPHVREDEQDRDESGFNSLPLRATPPLRRGGMPPVLCAYLAKTTGSSLG